MGNSIGRRAGTTQEIRNSRNIMWTKCALIPQNIVPIVVPSIFGSFTPARAVVGNYIAAVTGPVRMVLGCACLPAVVRASSKRLYVAVIANRPLPRKFANPLDFTISTPPNLPGRILSLMH